MARTSSEGGRRAAGPSRWRLRLDGAADGATNMATDHALALAVEGDEAVLRLYTWSGPTLSLGRNEPAVGRYDAGAARRLGVDVVRRPTGGRAVLHHRELTYAVAAPLRAFGGLRAAYAAINAGLLRGLSYLGAPVGLAGADAPGGALPPGAGACFRAPARGEVVAADGRKLVGSAQARIGGVLLQHGSILVADDQGMVEALWCDGSEGPATDAGARGHGPGSRLGRRAAADVSAETLSTAGNAGLRGASDDVRAGGGPMSPAAVPTGTVTSLSELLGETPPVDDVAAAVADGFRRSMGSRWCRDGESLALAPELVAHYHSTEWTWRR